jgi:hypothetical protein
LPEDIATQQAQVDVLEGRLRAAERAVGRAATPAAGAAAHRRADAALHDLEAAEHTLRLLLAQHAALQQADQGAARSARLPAHRRLRGARALAQDGLFDVG